MIRFALRCAQDHRFESWFRSGPDFDDMRGAARIECPVCGSREIVKAPMAPALRADRPLPAPAPPPQEMSTKGSAMLSAARDSEVARAIERLRRAVEASTDDVGRSFAAEARAIHEGEAPERAIRGEATPEEARALLSDGIPVMPLPFRDPKKSH